METQTVETRTRKVKTNYRFFSREQKMKIINHVFNRREDENITDILKLYELRPNVFYSWLKKMNITPPTRVQNVQMNVPMNQSVIRKVSTNSIKKSVLNHTITLNVEVSSLTELVSVCHSISQLTKVKTISVE